MTAQKSGQSCVLGKQGDGDDRKWMVEHNDDANRIAIKSVANNGCLRVDPKTSSITRPAKTSKVIGAGRGRPCCKP
jgi:hypothetical protein